MITSIKLIYFMHLTEDIKIQNSNNNFDFRITRIGERQTSQRNIVSRPNGSSLPSGDEESSDGRSAAQPAGLYFLFPELGSPVHKSLASSISRSLLFSSSQRQRSAALYASGRRQGGSDGVAGGDSGGLGVRRADQERRCFVDFFFIFHVVRNYRECVDPVDFFGVFIYCHE